MCFPVFVCLCHVALDNDYSIAHALFGLCLLAFGLPKRLFFIQLLSSPTIRNSTRTPKMDSADSDLAIAEQAIHLDLPRYEGNGGARGKFPEVLEPAVGAIPGEC